MRELPVAPSIQMEPVLRIRDHVIPLTNADLEWLARKLCHKLEVRGIVKGGSGVELIVGDAEQRVHLCYSDEAHGVGELIQSYGMGQ